MLCGPIPSRFQHRPADAAGPLVIPAPASDPCARWWAVITKGEELRGNRSWQNGDQCDTGVPGQSPPVLWRPVRIAIGYRGSGGAGGVPAARCLSSSRNTWISICLPGQRYCRENRMDIELCQDVPDMGAECVRGQAEPLGYLIGLHAPRQTVQNLLLPRGQCGQGMIKTRGGLLRGYQFRQDVSEQ